MEKYNAWIKELSTIVYDNSKSEYQILSELIPILLNIKSSQDTNSELMDTIHDMVFNKVNELESGMNTFTETFTHKLNEFKQEFNTQTEEFTSTLESNIAEFKEKINNKISTFNTTYASEKASIQDIADSINNINDTLISGYNEILDKINNFVEPIINSESSNIIDNAIEEKFTTTYLARESIYIDLVSVTTAPSSANEGDIYYNASEYQIYKYTGGKWIEENYNYNKIYRYANNLYHIMLILTDETNITNLTQMLYCKGEDGYFIGLPSNTLSSKRLNKNNINGGNTQLTVETLPENFSSVVNIYYNYDSLYYMLYYQGTSVYGIATSSDLINWTKLTEQSRYYNLIFTSDGLIYGNKKFSNGEWTNLPYSIIGYANNLFYRSDYSNSAIYTSANEDFSNETLYANTPSPIDYPSQKTFSYNNGILFIGNLIYNNGEYIGTIQGDYRVYTNDITIKSSYFADITNKHILSIYNILITQLLQYDDYLIVVANNKTNRYVPKIGLVAYE